ncbi:membrane protein [Sphingomonas astaxanthinifaciens DSM 22298]|uniref:Membrane protein n=2 Tax=Sphingomonas TaxID=13687 RepID=A0ABQ5Z9Z2_9SPHN|nr:MAPEG family protein [Sphingomonas astaxanthinifaciens]GLR48440.1 membrane protein [Sphingomonas astaxanthinifaciens DSM 22298]
MMSHALAQPVALLAAWTFVIFFWMYLTRIPAMMRAGIDLKTLRGGTGASLDQKLPPEVQWKAHNYNHLLEQPTLFYAVALLLMVTGGESALAVQLGWGYVALRIVHSLVQTTVNITRFRFLLFFAASLCLLGLVVIALTHVF